ncbi:MAG: hypothetical protein WCJ02_15050, partial [bacterium]
ALDIARQAAAIEKTVRRPQDIEGAIEYFQNSNEHRWLVTQSRSQVGYNKLPEPWDEYFKANREAALRFMEKHEYVFTERVPRRMQGDVEDMLKKEIAENQDEHIVGDRIANILRLYYSLGEKGKIFAGKILFCGAGMHAQFHNALGRLPIAIRADLIDHAAIDYEMLDKEALEQFKRTSNYNIARIIVCHTPEALKKIFEQISPKSLAFVISEVIAFHHKPKADWEQADIKNFSWNSFAATVKAVYDGYPPDKKKELELYISRDAAMNVSVRKSEPAGRVSKEDRERLLNFRFYHRQQAVVLSASTIDGCSGIGELIQAIRFSTSSEHQSVRFHFFLIMDIPNEQPENFLRRNGIAGKDLYAILDSSTVKAVNIIKLVNDPINGNRIGSATLEGDAIVVVGPEESIGRYRTESNGILTFATKPQRGLVPSIVTDAIKLLTDTHREKEERLSAWLVSRGLDGTKRYSESVYEAERYLEAYEKASQVSGESETRPDYILMSERIMKLVSGKVEEDHSFKEIVKYLIGKNAKAAGDLLSHGVAIIWQDRQAKIEEMFRAIGFETIHKITSSLPEAATGDKMFDQVCEFLRKEASFPRSSKELEEVLSHAELQEFMAFMQSVYSYYGSLAGEDRDFPRKNAEEAVTLGFMRNYRVHQYGLTELMTSGAPWVSWFSDIVKKTGGNITTEDALKYGGSAKRYVFIEKRPETEMRPTARRARTLAGETLDPSALTNEDFTKWAVETGTGFNTWFHNPDLADGSSPYRNSYWPSDFAHLISHSWPEYRAIEAAQDLIEFMYFEDGGYTAKATPTEPGDVLVAPVVLCLNVALRLEADRAAVIFGGVSPKILADIVHYASLSKNNEKIRENAFNDEIKMRVVLTRLIESQSPARQNAIREMLTPEAKAFLEPPVKKPTAKDMKQAEQARRKELARKGAIQKSLEERRKVGSTVPRIDIGTFMVHEALVRNQKYVDVMDHYQHDRAEPTTMQIDEALHYADSGEIWVDDDGKLHLGGYVREGGSSSGEEPMSQRSEMRGGSDSANQQVALKDEAASAIALDDLIANPIFDTLYSYRSNDPNFKLGEHFREKFFKPLFNAGLPFREEVFREVAAMPRDKIFASAREAINTHRLSSKTRFPGLQALSLEDMIYARTFGSSDAIGPIDFAQYFGNAGAVLMNVEMALRKHDADWLDKSRQAYRDALVVLRALYFYSQQTPEEVLDYERRELVWRVIQHDDPFYDIFTPLGNIYTATWELNRRGSVRLTDHHFVKRAMEALRTASLKGDGPACLRLLGEIIPIVQKLQEGVSGLKASDLDSLNRKNRASILREVKEAVAMAQDLLSFAKGEPGKEEEFETASLIKQIAKKQTQRIAVNVKSSTATVRMTGNKRRISSAIYNLLQNAKNAGANHVSVELLGEGERLML